MLNLNDVMDGEVRKEKDILVNFQGGTNYKQNYHYILHHITTPGITRD